MVNSISIPNLIDPNSARIYGLVARATRRAVLFRRGPSRRVRLLSWNLETDEIEAGQWLKARIYERRCDLSPNGGKLVYFAANFRKPFYSWTAISKPPYFTALAFWPKGDCWGGGGLFDTERNLGLNHLFDVGRGPIAGDGTQAAAAFAPRHFKIAPLGNRSGRGEDEPIMSMRMARDGWIAVSSRDGAEQRGRGSHHSWTFDPPNRMQKPIGRPDAGGLLLQTRLHAIKERQGRWYVETAELLQRDGRTAFEFGRVDWADLDHNGDVLYTKEGSVFRLPTAGLEFDGEKVVPRLIADLNGMTFEPIEPPDWARKWH
jgi:hypothetical protein